MFCAGHYNLINATAADEQRYLLYYIVPLNVKYKRSYEKKWTLFNVKFDHLFLKLK